MTTTYKDIKIEPFPPIEEAGDGLNAMISLAHGFMQNSILLFASHSGGGQPDMIAWLAKKKLLSKEGLAFTEDGAQAAGPRPGLSVMTDKYDEKVGAIRDKASLLEMQQDNVDQSSFESFDTSTQAFRDVMEIADKLRAQLGGPHPLIRDEDDGEPHLTPEEENRLLGLILEAVDGVHDTIEDADSTMQRNANDVYNMIPGLPHNPYGNAPDRGYRGYRTPWTPTTDTSTAKFLGGNGTPNGIVEMARGQVGLVHETNGDNIVRYKNGKRAPYDIKGNAWCAAFSTWAWEQAGYHVRWSNKNYVPAIWNDAKAKGWTREYVSEAQAGDMIIFDWEGDGTPDHVGIVQSVDYENRRIHTIEGNSGDQVRTKSYSMDAGSLVGAVKPPAPEDQAVRAS